MSEAPLVTKEWIQELKEGVRQTKKAAEAKQRAHIDAWLQSNRDVVRGAVKQAIETGGYKLSFRIGSDIENAAITKDLLIEALVNAGIPRKACEERQTQVTHIPGMSIFVCEWRLYPSDFDD